jgi:hypothetical protein
MPKQLRSPLNVAGLSLALVGSLVAQQSSDDPQRLTLAGLRHFAVHARVQLSNGASLQPIDESLLRGKLEAALGREGIAVVGDDDVRDGTQAEIGFQYLVIGTRDSAGRERGFAASACLEAAQLVKLQRVTASGAPVYAVVPTWRSCGILAGDTGSFHRAMLQNADDQIGRFIQAWRMVNQSKAERGSRESLVPTRETLRYAQDHPRD